MSINTGNDSVRDSRKCFIHILGTWITKECVTNIFTAAKISFPVNIDFTLSPI